MPKSIARLFQPASANTVGLRTGVVTAWNSSTGANTVTVAGTTFTNLPVLYTTALPSLTVGNTVHLLLVKNQYVLIGKIVSPPI